MVNSSDFACQLDFDQVDQNLLGTTEIGTALQHLDSYCPSDCQVDSRIAYHWCLGFEVDHLEEASCHSELQSFIVTSSVLGIGSATRPIAEHHKVPKIAVVQVAGLHHRHQAGMQIA